MSTKKCCRITLFTYFMQMQNVTMGTNLMSTQVRMTFVKRPESSFKGNEIWNMSPFSNHIPAGRLKARSLHTTAFAQYKSSQRWWL